MDALSLISQRSRRIVLAGRVHRAPPGAAVSAELSRSEGSEPSPGRSQPEQLCRSSSQSTAIRDKLDIPILATEHSPGGLYGYTSWIMERATDMLRGDVAIKGGLS